MAEERIERSSQPVPPPGEPVHLPGPSYLPVITASGLTIAIVGVVMSWIIVAAGLLIAVIAVWRWVRSAREEMAELPLEH